MDGCMYVCIDEWMDGQMKVWRYIDDGWMDEGMDGWIDGGMDG